MASSVVAALITTWLTVSSTVGLFTGQVTLDVPVAGSKQTAADLSLGAAGHFISMEATMPVLPAGPAVSLAWAGVLSQVGVLAFLALVFLLAYRLQGRTLFTARSAHIVGVAGVVLRCQAWPVRFLTARGGVSLPK